MPELGWRYASSQDIEQLAEWNRQLIEDEGHRNPMTLEQLTERMKGWLEGEYRAVLFVQPAAVAYALLKEGTEDVYLRQFFVSREERRKGIGRRAIALLLKEVCPADKRLYLDVLAGNSTAIAFWRKMGFRGYCLTLEIPPR